MARSDRVDRSVKRVGRPVLAPERKRTATIGVRVSATERAALESKAAQVGVPPAALLRLAALAVVPRAVPAVNREQWVELARTASNLNQLTRALQGGAPVSISAELLERLRVELHATRCALLGRHPDGRAFEDPDERSADPAPMGAIPARPSSRAGELPPRTEHAS